MLDDDVRIRPAEPEEAELLSDVAWRSKEYWDYPVEMMGHFRDFLTITDDFIERGACVYANSRPVIEIITSAIVITRYGKNCHITLS